MDAAADYTIAREALMNKKLPAYVSYQVRTHAGFDAIKGDDVTTLVVRTRDGKIVSGKPPKIHIGSDREVGLGNDGVQHFPFKPECYKGSGATLTTYESERVEAIALQPICQLKTATDRGDQSDFTTLYADPVTHQPIAAVGVTNEQYISAHLSERFLITSGFVVPADFSVKIVGSGPMFWLNVDAQQSYSAYRFLPQLP